MADTHIPKVVNTHHFGGIDKLPANTVYTGRPSPWGNLYSSKSGLHTKEECVALHRIHLYKQFTADPSYFTTLKTALGGRDLACWCVQPKRYVACHARTYLHVFQPRFHERTYTKSVTAYLMEDLRAVYSDLCRHVRLHASVDDYLGLYIHLNDVHITLQAAIAHCRKTKIYTEPLNMFLSSAFVDLSLALGDTAITMQHYLLDHCAWLCESIIHRGFEIVKEPLSPLNPMAKKG